MHRIVFCISVIILLTECLSAQTFYFQLPGNVKKFADHLFCEGDFLRAINEYEKYLEYVEDDTVKFKIALSFSGIGEHEAAIQRFSLLKHHDYFGHNSTLEQLKSLFILKRFSDLRDEFVIDFNSHQRISYYNPIKLYYFSFLLTEDTLPAEEEFINAFTENEHVDIRNFYQRKIEPEYRSPALAGLMSALIPGSGKIYTGNYGDGLMAFLSTGVLSYLAYTNFRAKHITRAWIFTGLAGLFYAGNIYGSIASAQIFNAGVKFNFENEVNFYLAGRNYYVPRYDFCR